MTDKMQMMQEMRTVPRTTTDQRRQAFIGMLIILLTLWTINDDLIFVLASKILESKISGVS